MKLELDYNVLVINLLLFVWTH